MKLKFALYLLLAISPLSLLSQEKEEKEDLRGIAQAAKINGLDIYIMSEPMAEYELVMDLTSGAGVLLSLTGTSIQISGIVRNFTDKVKKKNKKARKNNEPLIEALIIYSREKAAGIRYIKEEEEENE